MKYKSKIIIIFKSLCTLRGNFISKNNIIKISELKHLSN